MNRLIVSLVSATLTAGSLAAQTSSAKATTAVLAPPMLPVATNYHYWPVQFVQWVGAELPYSMIELDTDGNSKHPLLYVTLTERASGKRIHYTDNDGLLAAAAATGEEAHKTALAFEPADNESTGSISTLRFSLPDGKPVQWRFVQGSDISEQGSGLTPLPEAKVPVFLYREQAAVAGEGTALQIGDTVSTAQIWTEISQPPYFVAYHGAESQNVHNLVFLPTKENWTVAAAPSTLTAGATWELDETHGNHRSLRIDKVDGAHVTLTATDRFQPAVHCVIDATRTGDTWSFDRVRFAPVRDGDKHYLVLQFTSPLSPTSENTHLSLLAGKKTIAGGSIAASGSAGDGSGTLSFTDPAWLNGKSVAAGRFTNPQASVASTQPR